MSGGVGDDSAEVGSASNWTGMSCGWEEYDGSVGDIWDSDDSAARRGSCEKSSSQESPVTEMTSAV